MKARNAVTHSFRIESETLLIARMVGTWEESEANANLIIAAPAMEAALRSIQQWDCLNPPRTDLFSDAIWLRKIVDDALASFEGGAK